MSVTVWVAEWSLSRTCIAASSIYLSPLRIVHMSTTPPWRLADNVPFCTCGYLCPPIMRPAKWLSALHVVFQRAAAMHDALETGGNILEDHDATSLACHWAKCAGSSLRFWKHASNRPAAVGARHVGCFSVRGARLISFSSSTISCLYLPQSLGKQGKRKGKGAC
jgi:hypothetical protein